jgi:hypothetical protein
VSAKIAPFWDYTTHVGVFLNDNLPFVIIVWIIFFFKNHYRRFIGFGSGAFEYKKLFA